MIHENTFVKFSFNGTKGMVFIGDKMLTYRRDNKTNKFPLLIDLPGGGREEGESPFDTFQRELFEEFGVEIKRNDICDSYQLQSADEPDKKSFFVITKPLKIALEDIHFGDEGVEWMLMTPEEFVSRADGIERQQKRVAKYIHGKLVSE